MRVLFIHSDFIEFEPKEKAIKDAEEKGEKKRIEECLVAFIAAEKEDESNIENSVKNLVENVKDVAGQVKANKIVLYPYAHLSSNLASPKAAKEILEKAEKMLEASYEVDHAPFGWYKSFTISAKGHPLSELSREFGPDSKVSTSLQEEEKVKSKWFILDTEGKLHDLKVENNNVKGFDFSQYDNLRKFALYEMAKNRVGDKEPPHVKLMKKLELVDYEPGSDSGNFRFMPKGRTLKSLLERWVTQKVTDYGAMEVETPIMYDFEHPALKDYLNRFPARQYIVESAKKKFFLRFSACFGQFLLKADTNISYKHLPLKMYELTRYSFRLEKAGELTGLRRLRSFTMPDMHTLCENEEKANEEFDNQFKLGIDCMKDLGFSTKDFETAVRFTEEFWNSNKDFVTGLAKKIKKPMLIEMWNFRFAYFDPKFEFNFVDALDKASALTTVQIDHENAERYGITYVDKDGKERMPKILHCSPSGGLERVIYILLEKAYMKDPRKAVFPLWLSPIQMRICSVNESFNDDAVEMAEQLKKEIRVDVDDRNESIGKKVRDAEGEWVNLIVVYGEKEKNGKLSVRMRETGQVEEMSLKELKEFIKQKADGKPFVPLSLPIRMTKRPVFVG